MSRQSQKGGDDSTNIQVGQIVHIGIDERRAREICQEMHLQLRKEYTHEALSIANARVSEFENRLMPKMEQVDGALEAFADPSFQLLLLEAQKTAASTERPEDYDLLSELLIHRFRKGENRISRAGISLAVEIVDKVSDEALLGLTVAHAVGSFVPNSGDVHQALNTLNDLFGKLLYRELPAGDAWLDHLDVLDAVRLSTFGTLKKLQQYYPERLPGYIDVGLAKQSENHKRAVEILEGNNLPQDMLIDHTLNSDYLRLPVRDRDFSNAVLVQQQMSHDGKPISVPVRLSEDQINALNSIYDLYSNDGTRRQNNVTVFMEEWNKRPNLKALREWWDSIPTTFTITSVGKVLAHSNAQRCDRTLPPLN